MCRFIETIKISNFTFCNLKYHTDRLNKVRSEFFNIHEIWNPEKEIDLSGLTSGGTYKCRVIYNREIVSVELVAYTMPLIRTLKVITDDTIDYSSKFLDRAGLDALKMRKGEADDILIVKNGFITDTSFSNIIFFDGKKWLTPKEPLLKGTKRQLYIDQKIIFEEKIRVSDLSFFQKARIINAMIDLQESPDIGIENIIY
jgi:4-amino-4-deoxychorismate lyase